MLLVKNPSCSAGDLRDTGLITLWGRSPGGGHGNRLPYSCLEKSMDRGAWWVKVIGSQRMGQGVTFTFTLESPGGTSGKNLPDKARDREDVDWILG